MYVLILNDYDMTVVVFFTDILEGDSKGELPIQYEGPAQEHVGTKARIQTLQGTEIETFNTTCNYN